VSPRCLRGHAIGATLPNASRAIIEESKVRGYLLSRFHPVGRFKAALLAKVGFRGTDWDALIAQLRWLAEHETAIPGEATAHGQKYIVSGTLRHGTGVELAVETVWIVAAPGQPPRFVTLFPRR
jgi:hypothetical protein